MRVDQGLLMLFLTLTALQSYYQPLASAAERKNITDVISMRPSRMKRGGGDDYEGMELLDDMWLSQDQLSPDQPIEGRQQRTPGLKQDKFRWPKQTTVIYFIIDKSFSKWQKERIRKAILTRLQKELRLCITFKELKKRPKNYSSLLVKKVKEGCKSSVGYRRKKQALSLTSGCVRSLGTIQHEFLHALGLYHTQARSDRNKHVTIYWKNIKEDKKSQFKKQSSGRKNYIDIILKSLCRVKTSHYIPFGCGRGNLLRTCW